MRRVFVLIALIVAPSIMAATPGFAPIGVVNSQTARINAYFGPQPHLNQPCDGVIQLRFFDSTGNVLAQRTARFSPTASSLSNSRPLARRSAARRFSPTFHGSIGLPAHAAATSSATWRSTAT